MRVPADFSKRRAWFLRAAAGGFLAVASLAVIALPSPLAGAAGGPVVTNCNDSGSGSLRQAVADAEPGQTVSIDDLASCGIITLSSGRIVISSDVTITGPGAGAMAVSGDNADAVFQIDSGASVSIAGLTIEKAKSAAAIVNGGILTVTADTLTDNSQGAILNQDRTDVSDSTLSDNTSAGGGGGIVNGDILTVTDSTLADDSSQFGGGIYNEGNGNLSVVDSTLSGDSASGDSGVGSGGGIYNDDHPANALISGTILANDGAGNDCAGGVNDQGDNLDDDASCGFTGITDHSDTAAGLDPSGLQDNGGPTATIALEPGSAASDADSNPQLCGSPDQRGVSRPSPCDIGAYQTATVAVTNCDDSGSGSLRQALANASVNATISFALNPACTVITLASPLALTANVTIAGPGAGALAVSGGGAVEDFSVAAGVTASISGLTIEDGRAETGGGIANAGTLTISASILTDNAATDGGGGAIATLTGATTTVLQSALTGNSADDQGGAIFSAGPVNGLPPGTVNVETSTLADNTATVVGGAIASGGTLNVASSTLSGNNSASRGGGIESFGGPMLIEDSTLADNSSSNGGGFENDGSSDTTVVTSTLSGNTGGDITQLAGPLRLEATIVANSVSRPDCSGTIIDASMNLSDDGSCGFSTSFDDVPDSPAGLDPRGLEYNGGPTTTIALQPGSPAIDGVNDDQSDLVCAAPDQRGVARPDPCDIGAVDAVVTSQTITFTSTAPAAATVGGPTYTVTAAATSGLPVSLTVDSSATSVCSLSGSTVSFTGTGTCVLDANQSGGGLYTPALQVQQSFNVGFPPDSITSPDNATAVIGTPFSFTVTTNGALAITKKGNLPRRHRFVDNGNGTATLSGTPRRAGTFPLTIEARFGKGKNAIVVIQNFTLTVDPK